MVFGVLPVIKTAGADITAHLYSPGIMGLYSKPVVHQHLNSGKSNMVGNVHVFSSAHGLRRSASRTATIPPVKLDSVTRLLRLKLYIDQDNYDDIAIGFNSGASETYDFNEDSEYLPGINAAEGLASFSSDGARLSINLLPLPTQAPDVIRLDVEAQSSGPITLKRTELDSLPKNYQFWLVDNYKKDSIDLRVDSNYAFTINKSDTATFGAWRFKVIIRQAAATAPAFRLVDFNATKAPAGAEISWGTQNENNNTHFAVERSCDDGSTFSVIDTLVSSGAGNYNFTDNAPPATTVGYRVKITAANGTISYSNVVMLLYSVNAPPAANVLSIYPNPTNGMLNIKINQNENPDNNLVTQSTVALSPGSVTGTTSYNIRIVNISGTTIKSAVSSTGNWQDNVSNLSAGTYIITVVNNSNNKLVGRSTFVKL